MGKLYHGSTLIIDGSGGSTPVGAIMPYGGSTAPTGWLLCDGSAVSRTTYAALYAVIGTTYGSGDGNTTFNLPDLDFLLKGVKGNGMTLGLSDGTNNAGLVSAQSGTLNAHYLRANLTNYGSDVGDSAGSTYLTDGTLGITTDQTKSGIVTDTSSDVNYIIKY